jgi:uncharacterized protein (TIGR03066 family)
MITKRLVLPILALLALAVSPAFAEGKPNLKQALIGKWQLQNDREDMVVEFQSGGKIKVSGKANKKKGQEMVAEGTYSWVDDSSITVELKFENDVKKATIKLALDGDLLTTTDPDGKNETFKRVK